MVVIFFFFSFWLQNEKIKISVVNNRNNKVAGVLESEVKWRERTECARVSSVLGTKPWLNTSYPSSVFHIVDIITKSNASKVLCVVNAVSAHAHLKPILRPSYLFSFAWWLFHGVKTSVVLMVQIRNSTWFKTPGVASTSGKRVCGYKYHNCFPM